MGEPAGVLLVVFDAEWQGTTLSLSRNAGDQHAGGYVDRSQREVKGRSLGTLREILVTLRAKRQPEVGTRGAHERYRSQCIIAPSW